MSGPRSRGLALQPISYGRELVDELGLAFDPVCLGAELECIAGGGVFPQEFVRILQMIAQLGLYVRGLPHKDPLA